MVRRRVGIVGFLTALVLLLAGGASEQPDVAPVVAPTQSPAPVCGNLAPGPATAPEGAVVVDPTVDGDADRKTRDFPSGTTFWFAPGVHTLGGNEFGLIGPRNGNTYIGAPGAVLDGRGINRYAFAGQAADVRIAHLEVRGFVSPRDEGVVNHDMGDRWLIEHNDIHGNKGAGVFVASENTLRNNCIRDNGQYGFQAVDFNDPEPNNPVITHNEIARNNTDDWEHQGIGCGCSGGAKLWISNNAVVTDNWVHDNLSVGLWFDNNNRNAVVSNNLIEGNFAEGLFIEAGYDVQVSNNTLRGNAIGKGREYQTRGDLFPIAAIYVSENGSPPGYGLKTQPMTISGNVLENNWNGVVLWENSDRYCSSVAHTHPPYCTIKTNLHDDAQCESTVENDIPDGINKYNCRWSTEHVIVENNQFRVDKTAVGAGCEGGDYCGINGLFSNAGSFPEFAGYEVPWRITFQQGNVFRNNSYVGDWKFAGFEPVAPNGTRVLWESWTAPAPPIPPVFTNDNRPTTFGQDAGSTWQQAPPPVANPVRFSGATDVPVGSSS